MKTITIFVEGGIVYDVDGLPAGFNYEIIDFDDRKSGCTVEDAEHDHYDNGGRNCVLD